MATSAGTGAASIKPGVPTATTRSTETTETPHSGDGPSRPTVYRTYKRRWFGLVQLILLNIVVSWGWLTYAPVANTAAVFFQTTPAVVNWLVVAFFFAFVVAAPFAFYALHRGPKLAMVVAATLLLFGSWIRYGATRAPNPSYSGVMFGQVLIGFAQSFTLTASTRYSDLWFSPQGRVAATAVTTLANPFGGAVGQLVDSLLASRPEDIAPLTLYVAAITTVAAVPAFFLPAAPPTPVAASSTIVRPPVRKQLSLLARNTTAWLILIPFDVGVGFFNSFSTILTQILTPHGFSETDSGIAGGILILAGLVGAAVVSPILDRTKAYLLIIKIFLPTLAVLYLVFIWVPQAPSVAVVYVVCGLIGIAGFVLVPTALEYLVEVSWPVGPELTSVVGWSLGQLFGAVFVVVSEALMDGDDGHPPHDMKRALIFQAVLMFAVIPLVLVIGWVGDPRSKRLEADRRGEE